MSPSLSPHLSGPPSPAPSPVSGYYTNSVKSQPNSAPPSPVKGSNPSASFRTFERPVDPHYYQGQSTTNFNPYGSGFYGQNNSGHQCQRPPQQARSRPQFHYPPTTLPHQVHIPPSRRSIHSFFASDSLRNDFFTKNTYILKGTSAEEALNLSIPPVIGQYHSFYPLDPRPQSAVSKVFGVVTSVFKCTRLLDGLPYALRKLDHTTRINLDFALQTCELWKQIEHSGIIGFRDVFRSPPSLFFVYDYYAGSETLESKYLGSTGPTINEHVLWSIIVQLVSV